MASQVTHIVCAEKVYQKHFSDKNRREFFIGTMFPDVRYIAGIDRQITHLPVESINEIKRENAFVAGMKFHAILDIRRIKYLEKTEIYGKYSYMEKLQKSIKVLEDMLLYDWINNWNVYVEYLNNILPEELEFTVSEKSVRLWHSILQEYIKEKVTFNTTRKYITSLGYSNEDAEVIIENVIVLEKDHELKKTLLRFYEGPFI